MTSLGTVPIPETITSAAAEEMDDVIGKLILGSDVDNFSQTD